MGDAFKNLTFFMVKLTKTLLDLPDSEVPSMHSPVKRRFEAVESDEYSETVGSRSFASEDASEARRASSRATFGQDYQDNLDDQEEMFGDEMGTPMDVRSQAEEKSLGSRQKSVSIKSRPDDVKSEKSRASQIKSQKSVTSQSQKSLVSRTKSEKSVKSQAKSHKSNVSFERQSKRSASKVSSMRGESAKTQKSGSEREAKSATSIGNGKSVSEKDVKSVSENGIKSVISEKFISSASEKDLTSPPPPSNLSRKTLSQETLRSTRSELVVTISQQLATGDHSVHSAIFEIAKKYMNLTTLLCDKSLVLAPADGSRSRGMGRSEAELEGVEGGSLGAGQLSQDIDKEIVSATESGKIYIDFFWRLISDILDLLVLVRAKKGG